MVRIRVEQPSDHPLVLCIVPLRLGLEELNAALAQGDGDFHAFVLEHQVLRTGKKVRNDLWASEGFVCVLYFRAHRFVCLYANSPHQKSG